MKNINELYNCSYDILINDIKTNSKEVKRNDLFVCIQGVNEDRHNYIDDAIKNGASCLIVSKDIKTNIPYIKVLDTNKELPILSKKFYGYKDSLKLIGITGTDGKTTTASIIKDLLSAKCAYLGTNGVNSPNIKEKLNNTTPDSNILYKYFSMFEKEELEYVSMEVSSESILRNRVDQLDFEIGIITNITKEHLDIHKSMENYINTKKELLNKSKIKILNRDDKYYSLLSSSTNNEFTYGKDLLSDLIIDSFILEDNKSVITYKYQNKKYELVSPLLGEFNVYNLSAAILTLLKLNYSFNDIIQRVKNIQVPVGRCEFLDFNQDFKIVLDYAHTPNGLYNILNYLNIIRQGRIITIVGSAGGRDTKKRKDMGKIVQELSDIVIYTMDDPRYEKVSDIINSMKDDSLNNYLVIEDRSLAIKRALELARTNDIVLIAGKGRDTYMAINNEYIKYCDYDEIEKYFK